MKKSMIYTKTGDAGETGLISGSRTMKCDDRIDLYGELDELNSRIGVVCAHMALNPQFQQVIVFLQYIQSAIFDLGSNLACEAKNRIKYNLPQISDEFISDLELEIDKCDTQLEPLKNFILPGGSLPASLIHLCRTNTRSVERKIVNYAQSCGEPLPPNSLIFVNRLSDYFFVLARLTNKLLGSEEILWKPRK